MVFRPHCTPFVLLSVAELKHHLFQHRVGAIYWVPSVKVKGKEVGIPKPTTPQISEPNRCCGPQGPNVYRGPGNIIFFLNQEEKVTMLCFCFVLLYFASPS